MALTLLDGERVLIKSKANADIVPSEYGLSRFAADHLLGAVGMANRESIGGHLYVTSLRVVFAAHVFNRLKGNLSVPIPAITSTRKYRSGLAVGVEIETAAALLRFVNWSREAVLAAIAEAKRDFGVCEEALLDSVAGAIEDMRVRPTAEAVNILTRTGINVTGAVPSWVDALSIVSWRSSAPRPTRLRSPDSARTPEDGRAPHMDPGA